ncbi:DUF3810 domain-containing protein [Flavobacterium luteum]|uniref:DUF3810 domain-containing protein n=1 Tax=Flavobacterium luteum TaxID=2026654 RepID=A0A7J5ADW9_9FLAO|nr:DUF3810 domain-containing protein [Flavobacterium luteum]KAB1155683.1 DUF3810 domain-containing protein [Flavobacterium luteum]
MKRKYILPIFLIFQIIFLKVIAFFPEVVERFYSNDLYILLSKTIRISLGWIPFSVGDLLYGFVIIYLLISIRRIQKSRKTTWKDKLLKVTSFVSVGYFLFHFLWALNYYRVPLFEKMNIQREYTYEDLFAFTEKLIVKTNAIQFEIAKNKNLKVINPHSQDTVFKISQNGYDNLAQQYPFFTYQSPSIKKSLFSLPLTYMGFGGYLNPFTNEAQVNDKLPTYGFPNVVCHEMAHQIGFASESECNFIGFLASIKNEDLYFQYSAYSNALRYCMANIGMKDETKFKILKSKINPGIIANYKESDVFWEQYDTFIDKGFHAFYDQFLKFNQQEDGMDSYSKFVDLLINYYKNKQL